MEYVWIVVGCYYDKLHTIIKCSLKIGNLFFTCYFPNEFVRDEKELVKIIFVIQLKRQRGKSEKGWI